MKFTVPFNSESEIDLQNNRWSFQNFVNRFTRQIVDIKEPVADVGRENLKSKRLAEIYGIRITQIGNDIKDWDEILITQTANGEDWGTIFLFEILEHLLSPLEMLRGLHYILSDDGILYVSLPQRPKFLWTSHHFHEIDHSRCRYLFTKANFEIEWHRRIYFWNFGFGIRPAFRLFFDFTTLYKLRKIAPRT